MTLSDENLCEYLKSIKDLLRKTLNYDRFREYDLNSHSRFQLEADLKSLQASLQSERIRNSDADLQVLSLQGVNKNVCISRNL